jgi:hypothetical protein
LEDKVGIGFPKPLLINQEGAFFILKKRGGGEDGYGKRDERRGHARESDSSAKNPD